MIFCRFILAVIVDNILIILHLTKNTVMNHLQKTQQPLLSYIQLPDPRQNRSKLQITHSQSLQYPYHKTIMTSTGHLFSPALHNLAESSTQLRKADQIDQNIQMSKLMSSSHPMYLLMKEQIDIAAANYRQKMNGYIKAQAQEIQKLSYVIINHTHIINKQAQIIKKIREPSLVATKIDPSVQEVAREYRRNASKSPGKLSLTQKKFVVKPSSSPIKDSKVDVESKVVMLGRKLEEVNSQLAQATQKNRELAAKINSMEKLIAKDVHSKISNLQGKMADFCKEAEGRLSKLDGLLGYKSQQRQETSAKLAELHEDIQEIEQHISNISNRQFIYDSFPLGILREELQRLTKKVDNLVAQFGSHHHHQAQSSHSLGFSQRIAKENTNQQQSLNRSQLSSLSHYAPKYVKAIQEDRVKRSKDWQPGECDSSFSSNDDDFFYPHVESEMVISDETKAERLERIIKLEYNRKLPVKVEVDQTGYIKYYCTGMYILDQNGDGFDLSSGELRVLKDKGVIYF